MKIKIIGFIIGVLLIVITFLPATANIIKQTKQDIKNKSLQGISGIYFYQVDYLWAQGTYTNSNTGLIEVNIEELSAATGFTSGYINVFTNVGW